MTSHLQRTTKQFRQQDLKYWKVEYYNTWAKKKVDLFNIIDLLVLDSGIVGVQVCGADYSSHVRKITEEYKSNTIAWLESGGRLELHGWRKLKKKRGMKAMYWSCRIADILIVNKELYVEERK